MQSILAFIRSRTFMSIIIGVFALALLAIVFSAGAMVGARKARFSYEWGDNYHRNFAGPRNGFLFGPRDLEFMEVHGVAGQLMQIDGSVLLINGRNDRERTVITSNGTIIKRFNETVGLSTLQNGEMLVIIGEPDNQGQINAKFIRVIPPLQTVPVMPTIPH